MAATSCACGAVCRPPTSRRFARSPVWLASSVSSQCAFRRGTAGVSPATATAGCRRPPPTSPTPTTPPRGCVRASTVPALDRGPGPFQRRRRRSSSVPMVSPVVVADEHGHPIVVGGRGELSGQPATLTIDGAPAQTIVGWAGPWPLDERWWDERDHRRLARFQVVTADGAAHLVVVERQRWRVLASYT